MDLIYMNKKMEDIGVLLDYKLDLAFGKDENDFELKVPASAHCCGAGFYIYIEDTEYGGTVDAIGSDIAAGEVTYSGRTWHGLLDSHVIEPYAGTDYLILTGEANAVIGDLIARLGLGALFCASAEDSGIQITGYKMNRYIHAYEGIRKMLGTVAGKLRFTFTNGKVILSAHPRVDYTQDNEVDSDTVDFKAQRQYHPVNHLICLGRGELAAREILHLYVDNSGNVSKTQTFFGIEERTEIYDNPNAESLDALETGGRERLGELALSDTIDIALDGEDDRYDVQDITGAVDNITGLTASAEITKKIVTIESGETTISYQVGE